MPALIEELRLSTTVPEMERSSVRPAGDSASDRSHGYAAGGAAASDARAVMECLFGPAAERGFAVRYWDSYEERPEPDDPRFTLVVRRPEALRRALLPPTDRRLGEAYVRGDLDVEGDLVAAADLGRVVRSRLRSPRAGLGLLVRLWALPRGSAPHGGPVRRAVPGWRKGRKHSRRRDAAAIGYHYDVSNDFYRLFLDERMVYSCAYFPRSSVEDDLDAAQEAKLDYICRKLRLRPGDHLLDIGCGWAGLIRFAVERYSVRAVGITLSEPQAEYARERIAAAGLADRCRVLIRDYRDLPWNARFDKIASVGMVEHVGLGRIPVYFGEAYRLLKPGGLFLNHGIVSLAPRPSRLGRAVSRSLRRSTSFIERFVFPDGELLTPGELTEAAQTAGFETRDLENLREHYALTLRHWVGRLEANAPEAVALTSEASYRVWRLYMAGSARAFAAGRIGITQTLLGKPRADGSLPLPRTRRDLYALGPGGRDTTTFPRRATGHPSTPVPVRHSDGGRRMKNR